MRHSSKLEGMGRARLRLLSLSCQAWDTGTRLKLRGRSMNYYDWKENEVACRACYWRGIGRDATTGEVFRDGAEYHCPACGVKVGYVMFPTHQENLSDPRASDADRMLSEMFLDRRERFEAEKLNAPDQLPDLEPPPPALMWDVATGSDNDDYVVILNNDKEVWRELSWYENFKRFGEVARILGRKYGPSLRDLVPTSRSTLDLYGDDLMSPNYVARVREALATDLRKLPRT